MKPIIQYSACHFCNLANDTWTGDFQISVSIKTNSAAGTIVSRAPQDGSWKPNSKMLFIKQGKVAFDIGWVGEITSSTSVSDGNTHLVGVKFDNGKYHVVVDGHEEASGLRAIPDNPTDVVQVGSAIQDMAPAFEGTITTIWLNNVAYHPGVEPVQSYTLPSPMMGISGLLLTVTGVIASIYANA